MVKEEKTKLVLPGSVERGGAALALRAIAARAKSFAGIKVNVYAIGIYLNDGDVREAMRAVHGKGADMGKVGKTSDALGALERCERAARLVFARDVGGDKIADALRERIALKLGGNSASLKQFEGLFKGVSFQRGATLDFHAKRSGALETSIRGKVIGTIADRALANALFDAYLGNDPVVPSLKEQVRAYVSGIRL